MKDIISESVEIIRHIENEGIESEIKNLEWEIKDYFLLLLVRFIRC